MMFKLIALREAQADRNRELDWSRRQWGREHARRFFSEIIDRLEHLRETPLAHHPHPSGRYRVLRHKGLLIPYHVDQAGMRVTILGFVGRNRFHELDRIARQRIGPSRS